MFLPFEYTVLSSAKRTKLSVLDYLLRSDILSRCGIGPKIEPCDTQSLINDSRYLTSLMLTYCLRFDKYELIKLFMCPLMPYNSSLSKALLKSRTTDIVTSWKFVSFRIASMVDFFYSKPVFTKEIMFHEVKIQSWVNHSFDYFV